MITITPCTISDCGIVAQLWNAKRLDAASCWYEADTVDEAYVYQLLSAGVEISIASQDSSHVGFGLWYGSAVAARLVALAADEDEVYFRLLLEFCDWGLALGAEIGCSEIGTAMTTERGRMDALGVVQIVPIGFEPLAEGQDPTDRVPKLLRAECDLQVLKEAANLTLEPAP